MFGKGDLAGKVTDLFEDLSVFGDVLSIDRGRSGIGLGNTEEMTERCRLSGSVRPKETDALAFFHLKGDIEDAALL